MPTCNNCKTSFHFNPDTRIGPIVVGDQKHGHRYFRSTGRISAAVQLAVSFCPSCEVLIVSLERGTQENGAFSPFPDALAFTQLIPRKDSGRSISDDVPEKHRVLFQEAEAVLGISTRASACLSRRGLESLLIEQGYGSAKANLGQRVEAYLKDENAPKRLRDSVDYLREVGNWAAHEIGDGAPGSFMEVEPAEATYCLDLLEMLFDEIYVQPARARRAVDAANEKNQSANRRPLKKSDDS